MEVVPNMVVVVERGIMLLHQRVLLRVGVQCMERVVEDVADV
jgi:hypothetical protein